MRGIHVGCTLPSHPRTQHTEAEGTEAEGSNIKFEIISYTGMRQQQPPPPGRCHRGLRPLSAPHHFCRHYLHHIHPALSLAPPYPRGAQAAGAATEAGGGRKRALPIGTAQPREEDETTPITRRGPGGGARWPLGDYLSRASFAERSSRTQLVPPVFPFFFFLQNAACPRHRVVARRYNFDRTSNAARSAPPRTSTKYFLQCLCRQPTTVPSNITAASPFLNASIVPSG